MNKSIFLFVCYHKCYHNHLKMEGEKMNKKEEMDKFEEKEKEEMKRLGISEETMKSMKAFFAKTSAPRLIRKKKKR